MLQLLSIPASGGFNVLNLKGIKRRMIDDDKTLLFPFSKSLKIYIFSHLHSKFENTAIMTQKFFPGKNINMGTKNAEFMLISNSLMPTLKILIKKL
jgi:hypothetical protein